MITAMFVLAIVLLVGMALVMVLARNDDDTAVGALALLVALLSAVALAVLAIVLWGMS